MIRTVLTNIKGLEVLENEPLKYHTSLHIGGPAKFLVVPNNVNCFKTVVNKLKNLNEKFYVLGNGTNILCSDDGYSGVIILTKKITGYRIKKDELFAEAGLNLFKLNKICVENGLSGLEFSYGIPGSVGGAVRMNAGAFGGQMADVVTKILVLDNGSLKTINSKDFKFGYRHSLAVEKPLVIVGAYFKLMQKTREEVKAVADENFLKKTSTQPYDAKSAGSVFKRNEKFIVSKCIDDLGLKGFAINGAEVSVKHAGFIINKDNTTCKDFLKVIKYVSNELYKNYGFIPDLELEILGG